MTDQLVKDNERIDDLQNGYYVIQDPDKFCFGMDAVLLSGFAKEIGRASCRESV